MLNIAQSQWLTLGIQIALGIYLILKLRVEKSTGWKKDLTLLAIALVIMSAIITLQNAIELTKIMS